MNKKILSMIIKIIILLLPIFVLIFVFFYQKIYILKINKNNYDKIMECLKNDNISFKNTSELEKIEVSSPSFVDSKQITFFYSDNKVYYKGFDDNLSIKKYIEEKCFNISNFIAYLFMFSCIIVIILVLSSFVKLIINIIRLITKLMV